MVSAGWTKGNCYSSSIQGGLSYSDLNMYQSSGHCQGQCSDLAYAVVTGGKYCYCGSTELDLSDEVSSSNCDTPCQGYPYENCGGDGYFLVYVNDAVQPEAASSLADSTTSKSSTSSTTSTTSSTRATSKSSSSSTKTTDSSTETNDSTSDDSESETTDAPLASPSTVVSTVTGSDHQLVVEVTKTIEPSATSHTSAAASDTTSSASATPSSKPESTSKSLSGGGIAGVVVGSLAGVSLIAGLLFFLWYKRRNADDDHDDEFTLSGPKEKDQYSIGPNPFMTNAAPGTGAGAGVAAGAAASKGHAYHSSSGDLHSFDLTHNDEYLFERYPPMPPAAPNETANFGRRRLSNGSLPDMVTRNPNSLKVVNN